MSGTYQNWSADSPGGLNESTAAIREGVAAAFAATETRQAQGGRFFAEFGSAVLDGHAPVGTPGDIGADPDTGGADASDS